MKELSLNKRNISVLILVGLVMFGLLLLVRPVKATPASGLTGEPIASGALPEVVRVKFKTGEGGFGAGTKVKNIVMVKFTLEPGGTFGWHQHGGPVWAIVKSGTLSLYDGDDATCTPHIYGAGSALLDPSNDTHLGINETNQPVEIYATFMLPKGGQPRLDAADPGLCK